MATQSLLWTLCLLNLCVVVLVEGAGRNCFHTACGNGDSLTACVAGHWQCHHGETCLIGIKQDSTVSMTCEQANHAHCEHANHNDASCSPQHDCLYCCDTEQCVRDIEAGGVNTPLQHQGCFTVFCDKQPHLESCVQGPWSCNANQFCRFEAHHNGDIIMQCQDQTAQWAQCQHDIIKNQDTCSRLDTLPPPSDCKYCCIDQSCIVNILTSSLHTTTTPAPTTPAPTTTTPAPTTTPAHGHLPHAGNASCFTSDCEHADIAQCISGQWACTAHQYCHVQGHADGTLHMNCDDIAHYDACSNHFSHNLPECQVSIQGHCQYCCNDADCVRRLASVPATQPPATTTTTTTPAPTAAPTTSTPAPTAAPTTSTPAPTTAPTPAPTPAPTTPPTTAPTTAPTMPPATTTPTPTPLAPAASITTAAPAVTAATPAPTTATPAPTTAPTMLPATTTPTPAPTTLVCMDNLPNNACSLLMSSCAELSVTEVCRKTCGVCGSSSVHTTAATASPPQTVATASPVLTAAATTSPPTAAAATTTTPVTQCLQCGDFDNSIPCTQDELLRAQDEPCPPGLHYCMTDAYKISADSSLTLYKRCVDELTCIKEFYLPYMQNTYCQHLDPMNIPDILACHLCCRGDACNSSLIPNATSLYFPSE